MPIHQYVMGVQELHLVISRLVLVMKLVIFFIGLLLMLVVNVFSSISDQLRPFIFTQCNKPSPQGVIPSSQKIVVVRPLLKKSSLDPSVRLIIV